MKRTRFSSRLIALVACLLMGCATENAGATRKAEPLYLALELSENGHTIASPKLLGFEGRSMTAQRVAPGASNPDYRLILRPEESGSGYRVLLDLELPSGKRVGGKVGLLHGEERTISLDATTKLTVMLMRVDSPEFKALMELHPQRPASI